MPEARGQLVRRVRLDADQRPVPVYVSIRDGLAQDDTQPIDPDWLGVIEWSEGDRHSYELIFYQDSGEWLERLQFDSLRIALDQAQGITGVPPAEWEEASIEVPEVSDELRWDRSE